MASKVVIVTGASGGIGLAVAKHLIAHSHKVVLVARRQAPLEEIKAAHPDQVDYVAADLNDYSVTPGITQHTVARFGRVDGLVVNHGALSPMTKLADANVEDWARLYQTNVFSGVALVKHAIPELRKTHGCVVWVSSGAAMKPYVSWGAYGSSKAALHSIASHLAAEEPDICSVSIQPGRVDTDMQKEVREQGQTAMRSDEYDGFATAFREGMLNRPEEPAGVIANVVVAPKPQLSGANFKFGAPELAEYQT